MPQAIALGLLVLAGALVFWLTRTPRESSHTSPSSPTRSDPSAPFAADSANGSRPPVATTLATHRPTVGAPVPPSLDLLSLSLPPRKGDEALVMNLPSSEVIEAIETLFQSRVGARVVVPFGDRLLFKGELLRKETQPGTRVLGLTVTNETSIMHLERTRRGDYRGVTMTKRLALSTVLSSSRSMRGRNSLSPSMDSMEPPARSS